MTRKLVHRVSFYFANGSAQTFYLDSRDDWKETPEVHLINLARENGMEAIEVERKQVCYSRYQEFWVEELSEAEKAQRLAADEEARGGWLFR